MNYSVKLNIRGGILSSGALKQIIKAAKFSMADHIKLGERQNVYLSVNKNSLSELKRILEEGYFDFEVNENNYPNIISAYASEDIYSSHPWMSEGSYRDVLNGFHYKPKIKINLADSTQGLVPLFTGHLNFIPSSQSNYYYVYINHPSVGTLSSWSKLIYANDIPFISEHIENYLLSGQLNTVEGILTNISRLKKLVTLEVTEQLVLPRLRFPYYEGMNKAGNNFWLGIYRRNNDFSIKLLESICELCSDSRIGQLHLTPWKTLLIKGIKENERIEWEKLLGKHGINIRHSSLELNWQYENGDKEAIRIKDGLVKYFDIKDIRTYGLSFAIHTGKDFDCNASIIIRKKGILPFWGPFKYLTSFNIEYSAGFSLNATNFNTYAWDVPWSALPAHVKEISEKYYKQLSESVHEIEEIVDVPLSVYHCKNCLTVYDKEFGDPESGIEPGIEFADLPESYSCMVCEASKNEFVLYEI